MTAPAKRQPIPFGKYLLLDRINIGGMAEVWRGKMFGAGGFERLVAIKRILPNIAEDEEFISMFIDEAKITVQLNHANVAQVYELGHISNSYFIAMEYVAGKDVRAIFDRCRKKGEPAPIPLTCFVVAKMCEGLDYAHRKKDTMGRDMNIVHRDISPQNVLVSYEGEVKVIDFGIAKAAGKATKTQAGILKGKFAYMSPEQIRGLPLDRRSDVFAIGVCLYEMLTGERLFVGDSDFSVLEKVRKAEVLPPSTFNRRIPEALEKIVLKALAKDVEDRYQYANELADDLQKFLITSDSIFSRKDLMQYMRSTFAEDVEREKLRLQEYAEIKPSEGMLAALEMGLGGVQAAPAAAPIPLTQPQPAPAPAVRASSTGLPAIAPPTLAPASAQVPAAGPGAAARRAPSLTAIPKLTAAAPVASSQNDEEGGATMLVDGREYFNDKGEPSTEPGRTSSSPTLTPAAPAAFRPDNPATAVVGPPAGLQPAPAAPAPAASAPAAPRTSTSVGARATASHPIPVGQPAAPAAAPQPTAAQKRPSRPHPQLGRPVEDHVAVDDEDESMPTSPNRPALSREQLEEAPRAAATPRSGPGGLPAAKMKVIGAVVAAVLLILVGVGVVLFQGPGQGTLYVKIPSSMAPTARININGVDLPADMVKKGEFLYPMPAGPAAVMIAADGWETYTGVTQVTEGADVARLVPQMKRLQESTQLLVVPEPVDAEVLVNDEVVKKLGDKTPYIGTVTVGTPAKIEVRLAGYKQWSQSVSATSANEAVKVAAKLEALQFPLSVSSKPEGARIYVGGRDMGETPRNVVVFGDTTELILKKKCHDDRVVALKLPAQPGAPISISEELKKQPGCK